MPRNLRKEAIQAYKLTVKAHAAVSEAAAAYRKVFNSTPKNKRDQLPYEVILEEFDTALLAIQDAQWAIEEEFEIEEVKK